MFSFKKTLHILKIFFKMSFVFMAPNILWQMKNKPVASNLDWKLAGSFLKTPLQSQNKYVK